jgi:murein DD-endopeptidase MepM/ murein hydrolase activator NlpD
MSRVTPGSFATAPRTTEEAAQQLESVFVKQMLRSSGGFSGSADVAGSSLTADLFAETLADAVTQAGGIGLAKTISQSLASTASPSPATSGGPVVSSGFGSRIDPLTHQPSMHPGVDLPAPEGTPITAARAGTVIAAGPRGGYGNAVEVDHGDGTTTLYAHASEVAVTPGQQVAAGEKLGEVGQTGRTTGPHLHLELRRGGHFVDPRQILKTYRLRAEEAVGGEP